jgi:hypothetical protein
MQKIKTRLPARQGSALVYSLLILSAMLFIVGSISVVSITEKKNASSTEFSTQAYQTADSGFQLALKEINTCLNGSKDLNCVAAKLGSSCTYDVASGNAVIKDVAGAGPSDAKYTLSFEKGVAVPVADCATLAGTITSIKSIGTYKNTARAVEVAVAGKTWLSGSCLTSKSIYVYATDSSATTWGPSSSCATPQCAADTESGYTGYNALVASNAVNFVTTSYPARQACKALGGRLPTITELTCMYTNGASYGLPSSGIYWSSVESDAGDVWSVNFGYGDVNGYPKSGSNSVRCVKDKN